MWTRDFWDLLKDCCHLFCHEMRESVNLGPFKTWHVFVVSPPPCPPNLNKCKSTGDKTLGCLCCAPMTCLQNLKLVRNCDLGIAENLWAKVVKTTQETAFFGHSLSPTWPTYFFMRPKPFEKGARGMAETSREISTHENSSINVFDWQRPRVSS